MNLLAATLTALLQIATSPAYASDTLRCSSALVSVQDHMGEVLRKCGEPASRVPTGSVRINDGYGRRVDMPTEQWTYGPRSGMYYYLRFEGDRLVSISSDRG